MPRTRSADDAPGRDRAGRAAPGGAGPGGPAGPGSPIPAAKAELFRVLGHPVRIRILELLGAGERTVGELQAELDLDSSGISQHLAALRRQGVILGRKDGTRVIYRVKDPRTARLLEIARQMLVAALSETTALLTELSEAAPAHSRRRGGSGPNPPSRAR